MDDHPQQSTCIEPAAPSPVSAGDFRQAAGEFATGVTIVTTLDGETPRGMTVNSFASVSLTPPLVLWNVGKESDSCQAFEQSPRFVLHILQSEQKDLAMLFASRGADKFATTPWQPGIGGMPLLSDTLATLECRVAHRYPGGDHTIIVGQVEAIHRGPERSPLVFHRGGFA